MRKTTPLLFLSFLTLSSCEGVESPSETEATATAPWECDPRASPAEVRVACEDGDPCTSARCSRGHCEQARFADCP